MVDKFITPPRLLESSLTSPDDRLHLGNETIVYKGRSYESATEALNDYLREYDGTKVKSISRDVYKVINCLYELLLLYG